MSLAVQDSSKRQSAFLESMTNEHHGLMTTTNVELPTQRVKDTCDMCSASKVRCNKNKPICSRCGRLGYPCFYSPARRVRKPHETQSLPSSRCVPEAVEQVMEPQTPAVSRNQSVATDSDVSDEAINAALDKKSCVATSSRASDARSSQLSRVQDDIPLQTSLDDENFQPSPQELTPSSLVSFHSSTPSDLSSDCAAGAIVLLRNLRETRSTILNPTNPTGEIKAGALDGAIDMASASLKHIPTMLFCPCSTRPDLGILVVAICTALLDLYDGLLFLCHSVRSTNTAASTKGSNRSHGSVKMTSSLVNDTEMVDTCTESLLNRLNEKAPIMRILGELHLVADVVTHFRNRYSQIREKGSRDLFRTLVASIASRLKSMIDESINESTKI